MRWFLLFMCFPASAEVGVFAGDDYGLDYSVGEEWRGSLIGATFENDFGLDSYYMGAGGSRSWALGEWQLDAGAYALRVRQDELNTYQPAPYLDRGDMVVPVYQVTDSQRLEHTTGAPFIALSYKAFGVRLMSLEYTEGIRSTALQFRLRF